jgi:hypothetical protein
MSDVVDIAFPPSVDTIVNDCRQGGIRAAGLYVINHSIPSSVQSGDYARALVSSGLPVLPIITPGQNPPPLSTEIGSLTAWWAGQATAVMIDIEQPGSDTPDPEWVLESIMLLTQYGYDSIVYCIKDLRPRYPWGKWCLADWESIPNSTNFDMWQFTDRWVGVSGTVYDRSHIVNGMIHFAGETSTVPPVDRSEIDMLGIIVVGPNGTQWAIFPNGRRLGLTSMPNRDALVQSGQFTLGGSIDQDQLNRIPELPVTGP